MNGFPPPNPNEAAGTAPLRPVVAMSRWLGLMYAGVGAAAAVSVVSLVNRSRVIDDLARRAGSADLDARKIEDALLRADTFVAVASAALVITALSVFVLLVTWTWRMDRNMRALGAAPRLPGAMAIAGWFVPIANLVVPFVFIRDFIKGLAATAPRIGRSVRTSDYLVAYPWWFGQFAVLLLSGGTDDERTAATLADLAAADRSTALGFAAFAISAACGTMTFRRFSRDGFDSA